MQKKLIALAIAGLSTAAFAQSSVEVYGVADVFVGNVSADGIKNMTKVDSGGLSTSRVGFKGVEDLGNGLKALFVLEYGLKADQDAGVGTAGAGSAGARQQLLGLTGGFGTVAAGRLQTTGYDWAVAYDVLAGTKLSALQNFTTNVGLVGATNVNAARADNAIAYISPSLNGVTLAVNYTGNNNGDEAVTASDAQNANLKATLASAKYDNGPLSAGLVYANAKKDSAELSIKDWALGGAYNFGVATVKATYQNSKTEVAGDNLGTNKTWSLGVAAPVSAAGTVVASYASTKVEFDGTNQLSDSNKANSWTVAYLHALSKRTTAYAGYNRVTNGDNLGFSTASDAYGSLGSQATKLGNGATSSVAVVGLNHKF